MPAEFFEEVRWHQRELGAVGGFVFSAPDAAEGLMDRHLFDKWLSVAEKEAKLPKLDGGLVAPVPAKVGDRAKASPAEGRCRGRRLEGRRHAVGGLSAAGRGTCARRDERDAEAARARRRVRSVETRPKLDRIANSKKHHRRKWLWRFALESGRRDLNPRPPEPHSGALPDCATSRPPPLADRATSLATEAFPYNWQLLRPPGRDYRATRQIRASPRASRAVACALIGWTSRR